ncbi:hypothetical protein FKN01_31515, partial [Streptomyces sp. 130]
GGPAAGPGGGGGPPPRGARAGGAPPPPPGGARALSYVPPDQAAFALVAYMSTYSWPDSRITSAITESVTARST